MKTKMGRGAYHPATSRGVERGKQNRMDDNHLTMNIAAPVVNPPFENGERWATSL